MGGGRAVGVAGGGGGERVGEGKEGEGGGGGGGGWGGVGGVRRGGCRSFSRPAPLAFPSGEGKQNVILFVPRPSPIPCPALAWRGPKQEPDGCSVAPEEPGKTLESHPAPGAPAFHTAFTGWNTILP